MRFDKQNIPPELAPFDLSLPDELRESVRDFLNGNLNPGLFEPALRYAGQGVPRKRMPFEMPQDEPLGQPDLSSSFQADR